MLLQQNHSPGPERYDTSMVMGRGYIAVLAIFSVFVNLLVLTGPLFMLQVYDRVLGSRSEETLVALFVLVAGLYGIMGVLDYARSRIAAHMGVRFQARLAPKVFDAALRYNAETKRKYRAAATLQELDAIQRFTALPVFFAIFDMPWTPLFLLAIFIFHPLLGWLAVAGGALLITLTVLNQLLTGKDVRAAGAAQRQSQAFADATFDSAEPVAGLGMRINMAARWQKMHHVALVAQMAASDRNGSFSSASKTLRLFLQSAMLALGAWLVLQGELTAGAMIAASILLGRALAPIELAISGWQYFQNARGALKSLAALLDRMPVAPVPTRLPRPRPVLEVEQITVAPPAEATATLRMLSFNLAPGQALGVIGPSAAGKSTLARVLAGIWCPVAGKVRLDGAALEQYGATLGDHVGYLPQDVTLFEATVAENIARMAEAPDPERVVEAAKKAGAHEMILRLPQGYDTPLAGAGRLSGGQKQRLGLARAMFGDPVLLVLDEPNSSLDSDGQSALNAAIRAMKEAGKSVIIMAHRPAGIAECDLVMVLENGAKKAFGPRDEVLKAQLSNYTSVAGTISNAEGAKK